jgi:hypothetical protein
VQSHLKYKELKEAIAREEFKARKLDSPGIVGLFPIPLPHSPMARLMTAELRRRRRKRILLLLALIVILLAIRIAYYYSK